MTPERLAAMQRGRQAAAQRRSSAAIERVRDYCDWLTASRRGSDGTWPRCMPPVIPSDEDWAKARAKGVVA